MRNIEIICTQHRPFHFNSHFDREKVYVKTIKLAVLLMICKLGASIGTAHWKEACTTMMLERSYKYFHKPEPGVWVLLDICST